MSALSVSASRWTVADSEPKRTQGCVADLTAAAVFAGLALVWTFPLVRHLTTQIPGTGAGDNVTALWMFWWMRFAVLHQLDPLATGHMFVPVGTSLALHTNIALPSAPPASPAAG